MRTATFQMANLKNRNAYIADMLRNPILSFHPYHAVLDLKLHDFCELTFDVPCYYIDEITKKKYENPVYQYIECLRNIHLENVGFFHITRLSIEYDGFTEFKHVTAYSAEHELTHKFIQSLKVRIDEQGNDMVLYQEQNPSLSVMHKILSGTNWSVAYCDSIIANTPVVLDVDRSSIYDLIVNDIAQFCNCTFLFDIEHFQIYIYANGNLGQDTTFTISFDNLLEHADVSYEEEDIKTSLRVEGEDIYITDLNGGSDCIVDLTNYATEKWMGKELAKKYHYYFSKRNERLSYYTELQKYLDALTKRWYALQNNRPDDDLHMWEWVTPCYMDIFDTLEKRIMQEENANNQAGKEEKISELKIIFNQYLRWHSPLEKGLDIYINNYKLLCLPEYGTNYLKEGMERLNDLIENEKKKEEDNETITYTREHFYETIMEYYSKALYCKEHTFSQIYELLLSSFQNFLQLLREYYTYEGFVHDQNFTSQYNNIFKTTAWKINTVFSEQLFAHKDYEYIISRTRHFGAIEDFLEFGPESPTMGYGKSNNICESLTKINCKYDYVDGNSSVTKDIIHLAPIEFSYDSDSSGCNPWLYEFFQDILTKKTTPTNDYIAHKMGITGKPYFTEEEIRILRALEFEEEYIDSNFKHYESDSRSKLLNKSERLFKNGLNKIQELSKPTLSFTADVANFFALEAFQGIVQKGLFALGNQIQVVLNNHLPLLVTIKEIHMDYSDPEHSFSFTCDNIHPLTGSNYNATMRKISCYYRRIKNINNQHSTTI